MNDPHYDTLIQSLDRSIELFSEIRTGDATSVAAFDTLKQARAKIALAFAGERRRPFEPEPVTAR